MGRKLVAKPVEEKPAAEKSVTAEASSGKKGRSKRTIIMIPTVLLCLVAWGNFYLWYEGNFWFWGLLVAFLAAAAWILRTGLKKKRDGSLKWKSWMFVMFFMLFLLPVVHMVITIMWAFLEMLPQ